MCFPHVLVTFCFSSFGTFSLLFYSRIYFFGSCNLHTSSFCIGGGDVLELHILSLALLFNTLVLWAL